MARTLRPSMIAKELKDITISEAKIESVGEEIGRGAYGRVFTVKYCGWICAAKEIHSILLEGVGLQEQRSIKEGFLRECYHCSILSHPNIVRFIGVYYPKADSNVPVMIMELMDESLVAYIEKLPKNALKRKNSILIDVAKGLSYLHAQNPAVIHRDLSPNNILLQKRKGDIPTAKIADLGVAKMMKTHADGRSTMHKLTKVPGTVDFMPPEAFASTPFYSIGLDVFSYGGIMLFVATHKWPTPTDQVKLDPITDALIPVSEVKRRQEYFDEITGDFACYKPLIESCLHNSPAKRPTIAEVSEKLKELSPLVPALQISYYELTWEKCADLPAPLYGASVALHDNKVYVMADAAPDNSTYNYVYAYDINSNQWDRLPPPRQYMGRLLVIDNRITVLGGRDSATKQRTNKVKTFSNNKWINFYPNMLKARFKPGVTIHTKYVIVAGGILNNDTFSDNIEIFNWRENSQWTLARMKLPKPMWAPVLTISDDLLHIVGYSSMNGNSRKVYRVPAHMITSSAAQLTSNETDLWAELPPAPHGSTAVMPNSCPPMIVGGRNEQGVPTVDIRVLDVPNNSWKKIASLTTARVSTAVVSINEDSILVIGGYSGGHDAEEVLKNSITTVEKGTIKLCHTQ